MNQTEDKLQVHCPLCGEENHCANLSSSGNNEVCWCAKGDIKFPESLLAKVSTADRNKACICKSCILKHNELES